MDKRAVRLDRRDRGRVEMTTETISSRTVTGKIQSLRQDPALRLTENGRLLLRLLDFHLISPQDRDRLVVSVPGHAIGLVTEVAEACVSAWQEFAMQLEGRRSEAQ